MKYNALRKELNELIATITRDGDRRKPTIRRSLRAEWIYATDLPEAVSKEQAEAAGRRLREAGWESMTEGGWTLVRKATDEPPEGWFEGPFGPEAACCRSLLDRHAERQQEKDKKVEYKLIQAGEEGPEAYEAVCRRLHREWAERLRNRQKLPDVSLRYFGGGE